MANRRLAAVRTPRRSRVWFGWGTTLLTLLPGTENMQIIVASGGLLIFGKPTIARIRGYLRVQMTAASAAGSVSRWAFGITTLQDQVTTQFPFPLGNEDEPWLYYQQGMLTAPSVGEFGDGGEKVGITVDVDSKAMRIVRPGYNVIAVFQNQALFGASPTFECSAGGRVLLLPS